MIDHQKSIKDKHELTNSKSSLAFTNLKLQLLPFIDLVKARPVISLACFGLIITLIFYCFSESKPNEDPQEERKTREEISGVERAVDPRTKRTEEVLNEVKTMKNQLETVIENKYLESKSKIDDVSQKLESLENKPLLYDALPLDLQKQNFAQESPVIEPTPCKKRIWLY
ncbi:MAG: hypothetical protein RCG15_06940 [Candidatus Rickettsia vulgarisii]